MAQNWPTSPGSPISSNTDSSDNRKRNLWNTLRRLPPTTMQTHIRISSPWTKPLPAEPAWLKTWTPDKFRPKQRYGLPRDINSNQNYFYYRPYPYAGGDDQFIWPGVVRNTNGVWEDKILPLSLKLLMKTKIPLYGFLKLVAKKQIL